MSIDLQSEETLRAHWARRSTAELEAIAEHHLGIRDRALALLVEGVAGGEPAGFATRVYWGLARHEHRRAELALGVLRARWDAP